MGDSLNTDLIKGVGSLGEFQAPPPRRRLQGSWFQSLGDSQGQAPAGVQSQARLWDRKGTPFRPSEIPMLGSTSGTRLWFHSVQFNKHCLSAFCVPLTVLQPEFSQRKCYVLPTRSPPPHLLLPLPCSAISGPPGRPPMYLSMLWGSRSSYLPTAHPTGESFP